MSAAFEDFQRGDRLRFGTDERAWIGQKRTLYTVWREGTVLLATPLALTVECDMPNPLGRRAVIRKANWADRRVTKINP